jgi:hypothetical protein
MSAVERVTQAVKQLGEATVAQITPQLSGLTHRQILDALANAKDRGFVRVKVPGNYKGGRPTVWEFGAFVKRQRKPQAPRLKPPASVWDMANREPVSGVWPPPFAQARKFNLLGDWSAP